MVVALIALFISLGGVSYGLATGSINSREIENDTVQSRDLRDGGVQGVDVRADSISRGDLAPGSVQSPEITDRAIFGRDVASNTLGDREIDEPELDVGRLDGFEGSRYVRNVEIVRARSANDAAPVKNSPPARCPRGKRVIGGGARVVAAAPVPVALSVSAPSGNAWKASAYATAATGNWKLTAFAICG